MTIDNGAGPDAAKAPAVMESDRTVVHRGVRSMHRQRRLLRIGILALIVLYVLLSVLPFYFLFVRTFVSTKDSTDLWLWIPPAEQVNMNANVGNLSVYLNLDIGDLKEQWDIPPTEYLDPRWNLNRVSEEYGVPEQTIRDTLRPHGRFNGWIVLLGNSDFWTATLRTILVAGLGIIGINVLGIMTGTGLAGLRHRFHRLIYATFLLEIVIPPFLILLPQFLLVNKIQALIPGASQPGLVRDVSQLAVIVGLYIKGGALSTMIFTSSIGAIPRELEEAAEIDGASRWQYIRHVLLPLMKVPIAGLTVIMLPFFWNDFLQPFVYLDSGNTTLQPLIQSFTGQYTTNFRIVYTGVFVSILPLVVIYFLFRKWFISGVLEGAVKG
ncbi:MAG: carbohydrate ABC transporter permease [Actinobacteria bacterium]|nr:carbohydrate ABC transporter permease [Actinomycetota bacterium]